MSATESLHQRLGSLSLPPDLDAIGDAKTLTALDPARRILADLFKAAINAELAEAWVAAVANRLLPDGAISAELPVADVLELEPIRSRMQQRQAKFPLLAIYRSGQGEYSPHVLGEVKLTQPWTLDWILGPADVATEFQLGDTAVAVAKIVALVIRRRGHAAYQSGAVQFGDIASGIGAIRIVRHIGPAQAKFADDPDGVPYWAITIELETTEYMDESSEGTYGLLTGASYDYGLGSHDGAIPGLMYSETEHPGT